MIMPQRDEKNYPHCPYVLERDTSDNGFSSGWAMHMAPVEKYWIDVHTHILHSDFNQAVKVLDRFGKKLSKMNVKHQVVILPETVRKDNRKHIMDAYFTGRKETTGFLQKATAAVKNMRWMPYLSHDNPDMELLTEWINNGACGLKLHNYSLIMEGDEPSQWLSDRWKGIFEILSKNKLPVLWHVTQRLNEAPHTDGGRNAYWKEGWKKGVTYTNRDLLDTFLTLAGKYPDIKFIGAHQLHMGWENLAGLFDKYKNLYIDSSIGCYLLPDSVIYENDIEYLRSFIIRYYDRILFGTDTLMNEMFDNSYAEKAFMNHRRFFRCLRLPYETLQKISHENAQKIFNFNTEQE